MRNYKELKKELLQNKETREEYDRLALRYKLIEQIIAKRIEKGLSQKELAIKMNTKQSAISRLESGNYNPSFEFLEKVAKGLESKLKVSIT